MKYRDTRPAVSSGGRSLPPERELRADIWRTRNSVTRKMSDSATGTRGDDSMVIRETVRRRDAVKSKDRKR